MTINEQILIELYRRGYSRGKINKLKSYSGDETRLFLNATENKESLINNFGEDVYRDLISIDMNEAERYVNQLKENGIELITIYSENYPETLRNMKDAPLILFCKGDIELLNNENKIAIVGTRKPTSYGRDVTELFARELAVSGVVVVSGLAYGVDAEASRSAVEAGGKTIAVLGGGVNKIYPSTNIPLANKIIANGGLILSEYLPNESPRQYYFPERNRIISGLSRGVLIVEAGENSGSLITASHAIEQGKEIYVVPSNITSSAGFGSNKLIYEMPTSVVISPDNILDHLHIEKVDIRKPSDNLELTVEQQSVYDLLKAGDLHFDSIANKINLSPNEINSLLTEMELFGIIKKKVGNYYGI